MFKLQSLKLKFQMVAEKTAKNFRGLLYFTSSLFLGKYLMAGNAWTLTSAISLAVASILATTRSDRSLYFTPSSSQIGASFLQWPHHGASEYRHSPMKTRDTGLWQKFFLKYPGHFGAKYSGKICAKICGIYVAYMLRKWCMRVFTLDKMRRNAGKCDRICGNMRSYANFCINKYSKFWKCHYMR